MYVYFNNEGVLKTTIPHGEPVRQGSNLNLYICLEPDFFTSKNENIEDWTVNVDLILPNEKIGTTKLLTTKVNNIPETIIFQKTNDSEVTYDLKNGKDYLCYEFSFTPETSTVYAGTLIAAISLIKIDMVDGVVISKDTKYFGNANIFVEKTFGYGKRIVDESSLHYQNLVDQINDLNIKKATKEEVDTKLDKVTTTTSANQAYVKNIDGSQGMIPIVQGVSGDSIPRRLSDGRLQAKAGTDNDDVVNKKQLDDAIATAITTALNTAV